VRIEKRGFVIPAAVIVMGTISAAALYWHIKYWRSAKLGRGLMPGAAKPAKGAGQGRQAFMDRALGMTRPVRWRAHPGASHAIYHYGQIRQVIVDRAKTAKILPDLG
jgi:hypothetical protein